MRVNVLKVQPDALLPQYGTAGAACFDLHAYSVEGQFLFPGERKMIGTGLKFEVPAGYVMLIYSRSGLGAKNGVRLANSVGVIDSDYRGEVQLPMINDGKVAFPIKRGDRLAQAMIVPVPAVELVAVDELTATERGEGGFGSTGVSS